MWMANGEPIMNNNRLFPIPEIERPAEDLAAIAAMVRTEHQSVRQSGAESVEHARAAGEQLAKVWDRLKEKHALVKWLKEKVKLPRATADHYLKVYQNWDKCLTVRHLGVRGVLNFLRTGKTGEEDEEEEDVPEYVKVDQWQEMGGEVRERLLHCEGDAKFNNQGDNENIEWALWSWNPVTGCRHNCPYCYARDIANRFYEQKFEPSLWPKRLRAPQNTPFPAEEINRLKEASLFEGDEQSVRAMGLRNVFVCSMADLFGRWVPAEWIEAVLEATRAAPQWNFLFLSKFPIRMADFDFPDNAWVGTTVDCQARVANAEKAFRKIKARVKWLSVEPLIEPLTFSDLAAFQWLVIGGASASSQTPEWRPPRQWVNDLEAEAVRCGVKFYEKANLLERRRGYPGLPESEPREAPQALRYLPS
jgi:protein gp37